MSVPPPPSGRLIRAEPRRRRSRRSYWIAAGAVTLVLVAGCGGAAVKPAADIEAVAPTSMTAVQVPVPLAALPTTTAPPTTTASPTTAPPAPVSPPQVQRVSVPQPKPEPRPAVQPQPQPKPEPKPQPKPQPKPEPKPVVKPKPEPSGCDSNYSGCVPIASDVDCAGGSGNGPEYVSGPIRVLGDDHYGLDNDKDGTACE